MKGDAEYICVGLLLLDDGEVLCCVGVSTITNGVFYLLRKPDSIVHFLINIIRVSPL